MSVSGISANTPLTSVLQASGLSTDKAQLVEQDLESSIESTKQSGGTVDATTVRAALDKQIDADVKAGKLTEEDAAKVTKALDQMDQQAKAGGTQEAGKGGHGGGGGGGGGGGSSEKTELSRTVTVADHVKTTTIKYTDGTSETKTAYTVDGDTSKTGKTSDDDSKKNDTSSDKTDAKDGGKDVAADYLSQVEPGSLVETYA